MGTVTYSKIKNLRVENVVLAALLFMYAIRFANKNCTWLLLFTVTALAATNIKDSRGFISSPIEFLSLALFGLTYYVFDYINYGITINLTTFVQLCAGSLLMYVAGKRLVRASDSPEKKYLQLVWVMSLGMLAWPLLCYIKGGVIVDYSPGSDERLLADFWTGELWQATNHNGYCLSALVLSIVAFLQCSKVSLKLIALVPGILAFYFSLVTASRTNLILAVFTLALMLVVSALVESGRAPLLKKTTVRRICLGTLILIVLIPIAFAFQESLTSVLPLGALQERAASRDLSIKNDGRLLFWQQVIEAIPSHPFGGITSVDAAHNLLLDIARVAGVIPMVLMTVFILSNIVGAWELLSAEDASSHLRILNFVLIFILLISFLIEPTLSAKPFVFIGYCFICGMQRGLLFRFGRSYRFEDDK